MAQNEFTTIQETRPQRNYWLPALLVCFLAVGGFAIYQHTQINDLRRDLGSSQQDVTALRTGVVNTDNDIRKEVADLRDEISAGEQASSKALTQAQIMAKRRADAVAAKLEKEAAENSAVINDQISKVKESTDENANKIEGVTNDVSSVKGDVATAKSTIDQHSADLQSVRGDMGVMSGLVATNQKQIDYLKKLGDRNIYEFTISKKDGLAKVGDIRMQLARVNAKHNRYTVEVNADDKTIEKRDKTTNEPVQFYVSKARQPYELVVNDVGKDTIKGYLATPKVTTARNEGTN